MASADTLCKKLLNVKHTVVDNIPRRAFSFQKGSGQFFGPFLHLRKLPAIHLIECFLRGLMNRYLLPVLTRGISYCSRTGDRPRKHPSSSRN